MENITIQDILKKLHLSKLEHMSIKMLWSILVVFGILVFIPIVAGGWFVYSWATLESTTTFIPKTTRNPITEDELKKVEVDVAQRSEHYEEVLRTEPNIVPLVAVKTVVPAASSSTVNAGKK